MNSTERTSVKLAVTLHRELRSHQKKSRPRLSIKAMVDQAVYEYLRRERRRLEKEAAA